MEAIATLSLVCNVMQVISFGGELIRLCHRTFKDGTPELGLASNIARLSELITSLSDRITKFDPIQTNQSTSRQLQEDRQRLQSLASELLQDTQKLQGILQKVSNNSSKWSAAKLALKYKFSYRREITSIEKNIHNSQMALTLEFNTRICSSTQAAALRSDQRFSNLDTEIQQFITSWSEGSRDLSMLITNEAKVARSHTTDALSSQQDCIQNFVVAESFVRTQQMNDHISSELQSQDDRFKDILTIETSRGTEQLHGHITSESEGVKDHITLQLTADASQRNNTNIRDRILSALWFPRMNARENDIEEASKDSVKWIFDEPTGENDIFEAQETYKRPKELGDFKASNEIEEEHIDNKQHEYGRSSLELPHKPLPYEFRSWLGSDQSLFWISGKAGSGKSTLMKFLVQDAIQGGATSQFLAAWRSLVYIHRFFFIETGIPLQKQLRGCLRTLLHQIFSSQPAVFESALRQRPKLAMKISEHDWSVSDLRNVLIDAFRSSDVAFCIFLDGLDEIEVESEGRSAVLELVISLGSLPNVKVCASSRPENIFQKTLGFYPSLRLEDFTHAGIWAYAKSRLEPHRGSIGKKGIEFEVFLDRLVDKADGVFLWVILAIRSLLRGITNGDTWETLVQRTEGLMPDLSGLYQQMWLRQNSDFPIYRQDTAKVFWYAVNIPSDYSTELAHPLSYLSATHKALRDEVMTSLATAGRLSHQDESRILNTYNTWLSARSAGLLEIYRPNEIQTFECTTLQVRFIHRSVREFLLGTAEGRGIFLNDNGLKDTYWLSMLDAYVINDFINAIYFYHLDISTKESGSEVADNDTTSQRGGDGDIEAVNGGVTKAIGNNPGKPRWLYARCYTGLLIWGKFLQLVVALAIANHISTADELKLLCEYQTLICPRWRTQVSEFDLFLGAAKHLSEVFITQRQDEALAVLLPHEKSKILFNAYGIDINKGWDNIGRDTEYRIFESIVERENEAYNDYGSYYYYRVKKLERLVSINKYLLSAGADPNFQIMPRIDGPIIGMTPSVGFVLFFFILLQESNILLKEAPEAQKIHQGEFRTNNSPRISWFQDRILDFQECIQIFEKYGSDWTQQAPLYLEVKTGLVRPDHFFLDDLCCTICFGVDAYWFIDFCRAGTNSVAAATGEEKSNPSIPKNGSGYIHCLYFKHPDPTPDVHLGWQLLSSEATTAATRRRLEMGFENCLWDLHLDDYGNLRTGDEILGVVNGIFDELCGDEV